MQCQSEWDSDTVQCKNAALGGLHHVLFSQASVHHAHVVVQRTSCRTNKCNISTMHKVHHARIARQPHLHPKHNTCIHWNAASWSFQARHIPIMMTRAWEQISTPCITPITCIMVEFSNIIRIMHIEFTFAFQSTIDRSFERDLQQHSNWVWVMRAFVSHLEGIPLWSMSVWCVMCYFIAAVRVFVITSRSSLFVACLCRNCGATMRRSWWSFWDDT